MGGARGKSALWKRTQHRRNSDPLQVNSSIFFQSVHTNQGDTFFLDLGLTDRDQHQHCHPGRQRPPLLGGPHLHRAEHHQAAVDQDEGDGVRVEGGNAQQH